MPNIPVNNASSVKLPFLALSLLFVALTVFLGYFAQRDHFLPFISGYAAFFALYIWTCFYQKDIPVKQLIALGIGLRVLLLFSLPNLSDDYFRYLWDGRLALAGYHPFLHTPQYFLDNQLFPTGISPELFSQLNSPQYYTVYPPVCQVVFAAAAWVSPENNWAGVIVMKLFLLAAELGIIYGMRNAECGVRNGQPGHTRYPNQGFHSAFRIPHSALLYALNPLVILEVVGNCHFEGIMIFFLVAGILSLWKGALTKGALFWALATASKMLPLLFLPIVWCWLGWRKGLKFMLVFTVATLLLFSPLIAVLPNIVQSLSLYFQKFQFNASVYYLVREIGYAVTRWDIGAHSGPWMGFVVLLGVLGLAFWARKQKPGMASRLTEAMLIAMMLYLCLSAVVHPWYVCVPFALSLFTHWRFALVWTGLVALTYSHYDGGGREEHFWLIGLEYVGVLAAVWFNNIRLFRVSQDYGH
jgi:alpha-1,6-mannosyltransferase